MPRLITDEDRFAGARATLRLVVPADCTARYESWLADPEVNRYLETRWTPQPLSRIVEFVEAMRRADDSYLFAILDNTDHEHVGNLKIGPINRHHGYADVSYFIGDRTRWGRGLASDAIALSVRIGFDRLGLYRVQAGVYASNVASVRALERVGFVQEARLRSQLANAGQREDHLLLGILLGEIRR
jgi:RimJ/RimL family protein N-acetyltransferase